uniref:Uncharacterized protein n=1 Tax=uncultured beta proteobacterium HF0130_04F21 TaxID=710819 RepID=E0XST7_9PROT|nr:hypothetical protein [uncultured beta proteobacterium HF0130_04F21]
MRLQKIIRLLLGTSLIFFLFLQLNPQKIAAVFNSISMIHYTLAVFLCFLGNYLCSLRWIKILRPFNQSISKARYIKIYFESIAANSILPGGMLGADLWRAFRVLAESKKGIFNKKQRDKLHKDKKLEFIVASIICDRAHGFFCLCLIGIIALLMISTLSNNSEIFLSFNKPYLQYYLYIFLLFSIVTSPFLIKFLFSLSKKFFLFNKFILFKIEGFWPNLVTREIFLISLSSQIFFGIGFWFCLCSVGIEVDLMLLFFLVPGIFLAAAIPLAVAGFGPRETGALFFLPFLGNNPEQLFVSSILFGLTSTIIGILTILFNFIFFLKDK